MQRSLVMAGFAAAILLSTPAFAGKLASCSADLQKFCASATDKHAQKTCLKQHQAELSATCSSAMASKKQTQQSTTSGAQPH